jgi:uncharacterized membrane protein YccC
MRLPRPQVADPGLRALRSAARAGIVMPAMFAIALLVIGNPQTATFAAFGSFAMLVLVDFSGPPRSRFGAYLSLGLVGAAEVVVGTLCSRNAWLAAAAMAVAGFAILFSGVINGYFAAGGTAALLAFVLPVSIPAPLSDIGWRLAGWGLAAGAATCAVMLIWPPRRSGTLRGDAASACRALADLADSVCFADLQAAGTPADAAAAAVDGVRKQLESAPHRPTGPTREAGALAALIDELGWLLDSLRAAARLPAAGLCQGENAEAMAAAAAVLRASAARLTGAGALPDTGRLARAQEAVARELTERVAQLPPVPDDAAVEALLGRSFRTRAVCYGTQQVAAYALVASGAAAPSPDSPAPVPPAVLAVRQLAAEHASARSVSLRNSVRGAVGLAIAVFIAQRSGLQHSFWVVLGTLSVLRSNALGTGKSILGALAGTAAGIVVGGAILLAVGSSDNVLWGVLPVAVLVAAYAPRVISFAVGQAAFTVVLVVLFNIIAPVGWRVGLIRIEDVAIGFAVSLGVGLLFWPRGAAALLRRNMAAAYSRGADYVAVTARQLTGGPDPAVTAQSAQAEQAATTAVHQLDDAFRQYLAERSAKQAGPESAARLVGGATRLLRAGHSMAALTTALDGNGSAGSHGGNASGDGVSDGGNSESADGYGASIDGQVQAVRGWYVTLGDSLVNGTAVPPPQPADSGDRARLLRFLRDSINSGDTGAQRGALQVVWASQHLEMLRRMEAHLGEQALATASLPAGH